VDIKKLLGPVSHIVKKEFIELRRSKLIVGLIVAPMLMAIVFGFVATTDIKNVRTMICDEDGSAMSRLLISKFTNYDFFKIAVFTQTPVELQKAMGANKVQICVRIPKDFGEDIKKGKKTQVQLLVDGSDSNSSGISMSRASMIIRSFSEFVFREKMTVMKNTVGALPSLVMEERVWYNPELKSANVMVPGVIAMILAVVTMIVTSLSLVREKESGNIEQMVVTPVKPWQIILGKIIPYILVAFIDIIIIVLISLLIFDISFEGSFTLLLALSFFMIFTNIGIGILISTISSTQQQAMLSSVFILLPNMLLSGFIFPIKNMPLILQWISYVIPMRYYLVIVRGIFLKDLGFVELLPQTLVLFIYGLIVFSLAIKQFKKTVA